MERVFVVQNITEDYNSYANTIAVCQQHQHFVFSMWVTTAVVASLLCLASVIILARSMLVSQKSFYILMSCLVLFGSIAGLTAISLEYKLVSEIASLPLLTPE